MTLCTEGEVVKGALPQLCGSLNENDHSTILGISKRIKWRGERERERVRECKYVRVVTCRNRVDLPPIFGPVSSMMEDLALMPRVMLLGMTCLPGCGCIMGCRICLPFIEAPLTSPSSRNSGLHAPVILVGI